MSGMFRPSTVVFFLKERREKCKELAFDPHCKQNSAPQGIRPERNSVLKIGVTKQKIQCSEMLNMTHLYPASSHCLPPPFARGRQVGCMQRRTVRNPLSNEAGLLKHLPQILKLTLLHRPYCFVQDSVLCKLVSFLLYLPA